jgi:dolichol-phosphate mannosyltransferase
MGAKLKRFGKFNVICTVGVALNVALLNVQFNLLGMNRYLANAIAIGLVTVWNFWLNTRLSWRVTETASAPAPSRPG